MCSHDGLSCPPSRSDGRPPLLTPDQTAELWVAPERTRDLFWGVGGDAPRPRSQSRPTRSSRSNAAASAWAMTVEGPGGRKWSAKLPPEASTEVVASRLLWGVGYHQPPIYYVGRWNAEGASDQNPQLPGRFRESKPDLHGLDAKDIWSYYQNPFVGTRELNGLLVLQAMLGQLRSEGRAERALHSEGAVRRRVALVRGARPRAVVRAHRRARRAARRSEGLRGDAVHQGHGRAVRPLRLSRPPRRAGRSHHARPTCAGSASSSSGSPTSSGTMRSAPAATRRKSRTGSSAGSSRRSRKGWHWDDDRNDSAARCR